MTTAVLLDLMSIQNYIFASTNLQENLCASYIIEHIYDGLLNGNDGYIGGGNAFILFDDKTTAENKIKELTKNTLANYPGVMMACAIDDNFDEANYSESAKKLFKQLQINKSKAIPVTTIPAHGITADCSRTGPSAEFYYKTKDESKYISSVSASKLACIEKIKESSEDFLKNLGLGDKYIYTKDLGELGQSEYEDSHIAVVHIDANDLGMRFRACNTLEETKNLSTKVRVAVENAYGSLIKKIDKEINYINDEIKPSKAGEKTIIPIRPIVIGGDDITFVCDGRLGVYFAASFMKEFQKQEVPGGKPLTSCAGVSIVKTKYPFYRAYQLADDLCRSAKKRRKSENNIQDSYLDFHISFGGITGSIENIRKNAYKSVQGHLVVMRPYKISDFEQQNGLLAGIKHIRNNLPNSKIKELQKVVMLDDSSQEDFKKHLKFRGDKLLSNFLGNNYSAEFYINSKTPYFDMVELMSLLPDYVIEREVL